MLSVDQPLTCSILFLFAGLGSDDEVRLVKYLFDRQGYNPLIRPVRNLTQKVTVYFGLAMIQLINVVSSTISPLTLSMYLTILYYVVLCTYMFVLRNFKPICLCGFFITIFAINHLRLCHVSSLNWLYAWLPFLPIKPWQMIVIYTDLPTHVYRDLFHLWSKCKVLIKENPLVVMMSFCSLLHTPLMFIEFIMFRSGLSLLRSHTVVTPAPDFLFPVHLHPLWSGLGDVSLICIQPGFFRPDRVNQWAKWIAIWPKLYAETRSIL